MRSNPPSMVVCLTIACLGAVFGGGTGALYCGINGPVYAASVSVAMGGGVLSAGAMRAPLQAVATQSVLSRVASMRDAAPVLQRESKPWPLLRFAELLGLYTQQYDDSQSRALVTLASQIDVQSNPSQGIIDIIAKAKTGADAAILANALAVAFVGERNELTANVRKHQNHIRKEEAVQLVHRLEDAETHLAALRASDNLSTGSTTSTIPYGLAGASANAEDFTGELLRLQRAALDAKRLLTEAGLVYGERHPILQERQQQARRAQQAFEGFRARLPSAQRHALREPAPAQGGPDTRASAIASAEMAVISARTAYQAKMDMLEGHGDSAHVLSGAATPLRPLRTQAVVVIPAASALGFVLFGVAPFCARRSKRKTRSSSGEDGFLLLHQGIEDRALAYFSQKSLTLTRDDDLYEAMDIAAAERARVVCLGWGGSDAQDSAGAMDTMRKVACAVGYGALKQGWRVLLVIEDSSHTALTSASSSAKHVEINGNLHALSSIATDCGRLFFAQSGVLASLSPANAASVLKAETSGPPYRRHASTLDDDTMAVGNVSHEGSIAHAARDFDLLIFVGRAQADIYLQIAPVLFDHAAA